MSKHRHNMGQCGHCEAEAAARGEPRVFPEPPMHTPGPWKVIRSPHGNDYRCVQLGADEMYTTLEMLPADARLIAASPDLLQALKIAAQELAQYVDFQQKHDYIEYAADTQKKLDAVSAAIAKATD